MKLIISIFAGLFCSQVIAGITPWIDFNLENGHIKVPATVANIHSNIILDTGSQINAINRRFLSKNNLSLTKSGRIEVQGIYSTETRATYNNVPVNLFGVDMKLDKVAELNLGEHTNAALFGRPFFEHFVIQLDYPNSKMRIIDHESINLNKLKNIKLIKQRGSGMPIVEISLKEDKSIWLLLDTGNNGGIVIERNVAKSMGWLDTLERNSVISTGANSSAVSEDFRVPWIKFGPFELENVLISIPEEGQRTHLVSQHKTTGSRIKGKRVQGAIGYDVLKHFLITLDYRGGYAHIGLPEE